MAPAVATYEPRDPSRTVLYKRHYWKQFSAIEIACVRATKAVFPIMSHTAIDYPDEAVGKGGLAQREAPKGAGRVETHDGEPEDPIDDGLRARRFVDAQGQSQESEDARDGAKANASDEKKLESQGDRVDLGYGGESMELGLELTQVGLRRFEGGGDSVALRLEASALFALVTLALAALLGFVFPLISTVLHFGEWAHHVSSGQLDGLRPCHGVAIGRKMSP